MNFRSTFILLSIVLFFARSAIAQTVQDSVVLGAGYSQQAYYNMATGDKNYVALNDWDLAFKVNGTFTASVWANEASGLAVYLTTATDFSTTLDTADLNTWTGLDNSRDTWEIGALNANAVSADPFDFGWGQYMQSMHSVIGSKVYVLEFDDNTYKKIMIDSLANYGNVYYFRIADLDGANLVVDSLDKTDYPDRLFAYYDVKANTEADREPALDNWDFLFSTDLTPTVIPNYGTVYNAGTVYGNPNTGVTAYTEVADVSTFDAFSYTDFDSSLTVIGSDYRYTNMGPWSITDSMVYFVAAQAGGYYKLVFTDFGGTANGLIKFNKTYKEQATTGINELANVSSMSLYPNPAVDQATLSFTTTEATELNVYVLDMSGRSLFNTTLNIAVGAQSLSIPTADLQSGAYIILVDDGSSISTQKLMKY